MQGQREARGQRQRRHHGYTDEEDEASESYELSSSESWSDVMVTPWTRENIDQSNVDSCRRIEARADRDGGCKIGYGNAVYDPCRKESVDNVEVISRRRSQRPSESMGQTATPAYSGHSNHSEYPPHRHFPSPESNGTSSPFLMHSGKYSHNNQSGQEVSMSDVGITCPRPRPRAKFEDNETDENIPTPEVPSASPSFKYTGNAPSEDGPRQQPCVQEPNPGGAGSPMSPSCWSGFQLMKRDGDTATQSLVKLKSSRRHGHGLQPTTTQVGSQSQTNLSGQSQSQSRDFPVPELDALPSTFHNVSTMKAIPVVPILPISIASNQVATDEGKSCAGGVWARLNSLVLAKERGFVSVAFDGIPVTNEPHHAMSTLETKLFCPRLLTHLNANDLTTFQTATAMMTNIQTSFQSNAEMTDDGDVASASDTISVSDTSVEVDFVLDQVPTVTEEEFTELQFLQCLLGVFLDKVKDKLEPIRQHMGTIM